MRNDIKSLLAQKGYSPVFSAIERSIADLKQAQYTRGEIRETINEIFGLSDPKIVEFVQSLGY
jgi:hypothetical protein